METTRRRAAAGAGAAGVAAAAAAGGAAGVAVRSAEARPAAIGVAGGPVTFASLRRRWPALLPLAVVLPLVLGVAALVGGGSLLVWDAPITDTLVAHRTAWADRLALAVSRLGSWVVVYPVGAVLALVAARRSRSLALVMLVTIAARPGIEWLLKDIVARPRPAGDRLVAGTGYSYPSGHVLAAAATWAFLPAVVALYTHRRAIWWAAVGLAGTLVALIAWSRVWLAVHWTSDVVASLALSFLAFSAVEAWLARRHRAGAGPPPSPAPAGRADRDLQVAGVGPEGRAGHLGAVEPGDVDEPE